MANNWAKRAEIFAEITVTDAARYSGMNNAQVAADLNSNMVPAPARETLTASELFEAIDLTEYSALGAAKQEQIRVILSLGDTIQVGNGTRARAWFLDAFPSGTTFTALADLVTRTQSKAAELGFPGVKEAEVRGARVFGNGGVDDPAVVDVNLP